MGNFYCDKMNEGNMNELQQDDTYSLYQVKYNTEKDINDSIWPVD